MKMLKKYNSNAVTVRIKYFMFTYMIYGITNKKGEIYENYQFLAFYGRSLMFLMLVKTGILKYLGMLLSFWHQFPSRP